MKDRAKVLAGFFDQTPGFPKVAEAMAPHVKAMLEDAEPRPKGCECHLEAGDSPCPIHGDADE